MIRNLFALSLAIGAAATLAAAPVVNAGSQGTTSASPRPTVNVGSQGTTSASPKPTVNVGSQEATAPAKKTVVDVAAEAGSFTKLIQALEAANLVKVLSGEGPFTVFAPTDEAFAALPQGTLEDLLRPENREKLTQILNYHVIPGKVLSKDLKEGEVATLEGSSVKISLTDGVKVNDAKVTQADIEAANGVIHVIDKVIMPPQK